MASRAAAAAGLIRRICVSLKKLHSRMMLNLANSVRDFRVEMEIFLKWFGPILGSKWTYLGSNKDIFGLV